MRSKSWIRLLSAAVAALLVSPALAQDKPEGPKPLVRDVGPPESTEQPAAGGYWLGVETAPVADVLRSHLKLPADQGVLVAGVAPDSPAAKAGIQKHDILLTVNDQPLGDPAKLVEAVKNSQGKELALKVLRTGKEETIKITPAARPAPAAAYDPVPLPNRTPQEALRSWLQGEADPRRLRILPPGMRLPELPDDLAVTITRHGKSPAKISVKQGGKGWEVTEQELDKLPEDVRKHVEPLLGRRPFRIAIDGPTEYRVPDSAGPMGVPFSPAGENEQRMLQWMQGMQRHVEANEKRIQKQMEEMLRKVEEMRKSIEEQRTKSKETT